MPRFTRIGLALFGLALAVPAGVMADPPVTYDAYPAPAQPRPQSKPKPQPKPHHWSLFHRPHLCVGCQRAELQAKGIPMQPPPVLPAGMPVKAVQCDRCNGHGPTVSATTTMMPGQVVYSQVGGAPGHAVVGGGAAPGYAVIGGSIPTVEPAPVGTMANYGRRNKNQPKGGQAAPGDSSVTQTSVAKTPMGGPGHNRPHIITHMLGLSAIGRDSREARERRSRETHAAIPYGAPAEPVVDLPASTVARYSNR